MKRRLYAWLSYFTLVLSLNLYSTETPHPAYGLDPIIEGNSRFAFDLYQKFKTQRGNFFFSPYSISAAFALTIAGAKGETANEIQQVLHYPVNLFPILGVLNQQLLAGNGEKNNPSQLFLADAGWVQKGMQILPAFETSIKQSFGTSLGVVNFAQEPINAAKVINKWVADQTQNKISQLLMPQDVSANTRLVLTSAVYMKAPWLHPFDPRQTARAPFRILNRQTIQALMMKHTAVYPLFVHQQFAMLEIPYLNKSEKGAQLAMILILPHEEVGLDHVENQLAFDNWRNWINQLHPRRVNLMLPKFRIEDRMDLNQTMKELGMIQAFSPKADFSGITGQKDLFISKAIHKTFIRVDEQGTEAAAATGVSLNVTAILSPEEPYDFVADHPFIVLILDKRTHSILFMGRVMQP